MYEEVGERRRKTTAAKAMEEPLLREMNRINNSTRETIESRVKTEVQVHLGGITLTSAPSRDEQGSLTVNRARPYSFTLLHVERGRPIAFSTSTLKQTLRLH